MRRDAQQRAEPLQAQYGVRLEPQEPVALELLRPQRGVVVLQGRSESLLGAIWRRAAALGVRESGF
ncbi:hypothetical protein D3C78_1952640 [compost metagenome]